MATKPDQERHFVLESPTRAALSVRTWQPGGGGRAVLLVQHGLAEHGARYMRLGRELAAAGIATYVHDHRGHGSTTAQDAPLRRFASRDGATKVMRDVHAVRECARRDHPDLPVFVLGHSLGGLIALNYACRFGDGLAGCMIWNAGSRYGWQEKLGGTALRVEKMLKGSDVASQVFARATFDVWARSVPNRRTDVDWLSHDAQVVDAYLGDPLCGWTPTVSMVEDILKLARCVGNHEFLSDLPHGLPIQCAGGTEDPATERGEQVKRLAQRLREAGSRNVEFHLLQGARHETFLEAEPIRTTAVDLLLAFIDRNLDHAVPEDGSSEPDQASPESSSSVSRNSRNSTGVST